MNLIVNIDGASRGNPGPASAGLVIRDRAAGKVVHEAGYLLGQSTNNVAEYQGLLKALEVLAALPREPGGVVHIHSDSQLMVRQITGEYRVKSADLQPLVARAQMMLRKLGTWKIFHVPRAENRRADELANMALDAGRDVIVTSGDGLPTSPVTEWAKPATTGSSSASASPAAGSLFTARLTASPGGACPARCPAKTPFAFGPKTPANFCVYAAQAVFDENPTLWNLSKTTQAQTQCSRCGVGIEIVAT